jgi:anti-anti-sigma regulatory factor
MDHVNMFGLATVEEDQGTVFVACGVLDVSAAMALKRALLARPAGAHSVVDASALEAGSELGLMLLSHSLAALEASGRRVTCSGLRPNHASQLRYPFGSR